MKCLSKIICFLLVASMILAVPAMAAEQASNYFMSHSCYLWEVSDSQFQAWFNVTAVEGMDVLGVEEILIQRSTDRSNWTTVATYGGNYGYNTGYHSGHVTYSSASSGYYYRARVTFYAENDTGCGYYTDYTSSLHY